MASDVKERLARHQVENLILLIGGNPLPNAVAGRLLCRPGGTLYLLHTSATLPIADRLRSWLQRSFQNHIRICMPPAVEESNAGTVQQRVKELVSQAAGSSVGLHYTGGTKVMGVHSYLALQALRQQLSDQVEASYLDSRSLSFLFDPPDPFSAAYSEKVPVGGTLQISVDDMLALHGWKLFSDRLYQPILPDSASELGRVHADRKKVAAWQSWLNEELFTKARRMTSIEGRCALSPDHGVCQVQVPDEEKWRSQGQLKDVTLSLPDSPALADLARALQRELGGGNDLAVGAAAGVCGYRDREDFCKWLDGIWLESYVMLRLQELQQDGIGLHDVCMDLKPGPPEASRDQFQFDVVAIHGYQFFAFSCTTISESQPRGKSLLKSKLMEAVQRGQQMGGDQACVALVCCSDQPGQIEQEVRSTFSDGAVQERIRVFGREHMGSLKDYLREWVKSQTGQH